ncbi:MAG TPA: hypothetical protein VMF13_12795, partial [Luteitalea sp.]|nr:hypothetical protein [Luteitalea sp.]
MSRPSAAATDVPARHDHGRDERGRSLVPRVLLAGALAMLLVGLAGAGVVLYRLGADADATTRRIEADVRDRFAAHTASLSGIVAQLAARPDVVQSLDAGTRDPRVLFEALDVVSRRAVRDVAITIAAPDGTAVAWAGRPQAVPPGRAADSAALVLAPGALGLRLVYIEPVRRTEGKTTRLLGAIAAEHLLSRAPRVEARDAEPASFDTSLLDVTLLPRYYGDTAVPADARTFTIQGPAGAPLVDVAISRSAVLDLRATWWRRLLALVGVTLAATMLVLAGVCAWERRWLSPLRYRQFTWLAFLALLVARVLLWIAWPPLQDALGAAGMGLPLDDALGWLHRTPFDLCVTAFLLLAAVMLVVDPLRRIRLSMRHVRQRPAGTAARVAAFTATQLAVGSVLAVLVAALTRFVQDTVTHTELDVLMLALLPPVEPGRVLVLLGLLGLVAAVFWGAVVALRVGLLRWSLVGLGVVRRVIWPLVLWTLPLAIGLLVARARDAHPPDLALLAMAVSAGVATIASVRGLAWFRRGTQARRLLSIYGALLVPALLLYPLLLDAVDRARRDLVMTQYAPQVVSHPRDLLAHLNSSLDQLDAVRDLGAMIEAAPREPGRVPTDTAFALWRKTALADWRLTSAVELYAPDGPLVSRFGFNFPEYQASVPLWRSAMCTWDVFAEASLFGSEERSMLHAERALCEPTPDGRERVRGGIILHVMLDYSSLPFLSTQGPYYDLLRGRVAEAATRQDRATRDIDLVVYGWGRSPIYSFGERVWPLPQHVFNRAYQTREAFWETQVRGTRVYDIHVSNDRLGIY